MSCFVRFVAALFITGGSSLSFGAEMPLHGVWYRPCWEGVKAFNYEHTMTFGQDLTIDGRTYPGESAVTNLRFTVQPSCKKMDVEFRGVAEVKAWDQAVTLLDGSTASQIDTRWITAEVRPLSSTAAANFKKEALCGIDDWKENEFRDIAGRECADGLRPPEKGGEYRQIFRIGDARTIKNPHPNYRSEGARAIFGNDEEREMSGNFRSGPGAKSAPNKLNAASVYFRVSAIPENEPEREIVPLKKARKKRAVIGGGSGK